VPGKVQSSTGLVQLRPSGPRSARPAAGAARRWRVSLSAEARAVLDEAERQRAERRDRSLAARHLVLGLVTQPGLFADALSARGITAASVRDSL
jgi:hypothetical protein